MAPLSRIQNDLFHLGSDLCVTEAEKAERPLPRIEERHVDWLEARDRCLERAAAGARELRSSRRKSRRGAPARRAHRLQAGRADFSSRWRGGAGRRLGAALPQSTLRPSLRLRARRESLEWRPGPAVEFPRLTRRAGPCPAPQAGQFRSRRRSRSSTTARLNPIAPWASRRSSSR